MTRDKAFQQYREEIVRIYKQSREAEEKARAILEEQLKTIREASYKEKSDG